MYEDRVESAASFIALPSDQLFDDIQGSTSRRKRRRTLPQSSDNDNDNSVDQFLKDVPEIASKFTVMSKIGTGTFSTVYLACLKEDPSKCYALKHILETSVAWRIENELKCLTIMSDNDYVMSLETYVRHNDHVVLVMPFFDHSKFQDYVDDVSIKEIQEYMRSLFTALRVVHSYHIIHRDVKPSNCLYNRKERRFKLVDFGLAQTEPSYKDQVGPSNKAEHNTILKSGSEAITDMPSSRAVRMSPRLANKRNSQAGVSSSSTSTPTMLRSCKKENTIAIATSMSTGRSVTTGDQRSCIFTASGSRVPASRGRRTNTPSSVGVARSTRRTAGRGSLKCSHSSAEVCNRCIQRLGQKSPRAGTPGFRPPEVLLKYPNQTTAVDIWSAGVILLCLLSGQYPFFKANDDLTAMMQIVSLMGSQECEEAAKQFGKELTYSSACPAQELSNVCQKLRAAQIREKPLVESVNRREHNLDTLPCKPTAAKGITSPIREVAIEIEDIRKISSPSNTIDVKVKLEQASSSKDENIKLTFCRSCINCVEIAPMTTHSLCSKCVQRINKQCAKLADKRALALHKLPVSDNNVSAHDTRWTAAPDEAYDLLKRCLDLNPLTRITANDALHHPFLKDTG